MNRIVLEHVAGFLVVLALSLAMLVIIHDRRETRQAQAVRVLEPYLRLRSIDLGDPQQGTLVVETFRSFYPHANTQVDELSDALDTYRRDLFSAGTRSRREEERALSAGNIGRLLLMFGQFTVVFVLVLVLTFHAGRVAAVRRFFREQNGEASLMSRWKRLSAQDDIHSAPIATVIRGGALVFQVVFASAASLILFSPAYVIAYAFKPVVDAGGQLAMVILAIVSNGLLVSATTTFHNLLVHERRKGYTETAVIKGLDVSYALPGEWERRWWALVFPLRAFPRHVFRHMYMNARQQYFPMIKQHAAFLITGLIIIEMALNIQGHLCYELLQRILDGDADGVVFIGMCIFLLMKSTELVVDVLRYRELRRYETATAT